MVTAIDGIDALDILERERCSFDLIVLDLVMPRPGGRDTLLAIRERYGDEVPVLISSGYSRGTSIDELLFRDVSASCRNPIDAMNWPVPSTNGDRSRHQRHGSELKPPQRHQAGPTPSPANTAQNMPIS